MRKVKTKISQYIVASKLQSKTTVMKKFTPRTGVGIHSLQCQKQLLNLLTICSIAIHCS